MGNCAAECKISSGCVMRQYRACVVDLFGLGIVWCMLLCSVYNLSHPDLVCFFFVPALYSTFTYLSPLFLWSIMIAERCRLMHMHAKKYIFVVVCGELL